MSVALDIQHAIRVSCIILSPVACQAVGSSTKLLKKKSVFDFLRTFLCEKFIILRSIQRDINLLAPELFFLILAHSVYKM